MGTESCWTIYSFILTHGSHSQKCDANVTSLLPREELFVVMIPGVHFRLQFWTKNHGLESKETYPGQLSNGYVGLFGNAFTAHNMFNVFVQSHCIDHCVHIAEFYMIFSIPLMNATGLFSS